MQAKSPSKTKPAAPKPTPLPSPAPPPEASADLLDMEEAIALLKTTRPTFYRWVRAGRLKGTKVGRQWRFLRAEVERFLKGEEPQIDLPADITPLIGTLRTLLKEHPEAASSTLPQESELATAIHLMIRLAVQMRASDIHIDSQPNNLATIRYRVDGALRTIAQFDLRLLPPVVKQWKIWAACNVHETKRPQHGRMLLKYPGQELDLHVIFIPTVLGEALTARLIDPKAALIHLDQIAYAEADARKIRHWLESPWGTIIVTGPSGTGKTSTLYACLNYIASSSSRKVMTVEDPVEYLLPGATQVPVQAEAGMTFGATLRALLKSNPDVVMVGEIRDLETLTLAQQAALGGRLILINLHTSEAATALQRMLDAGANSFVVADSTKLILAQRLVRVLCPACSLRKEPAETFLALAKKIAQLSGLAWDSLPSDFREPVGCKECNRTGFTGRTVIAETMEITPRICAALNNRVPPQELRAIAISEGMTTMGSDGLQKAAQGKTSLGEIVKVVSPIYSREIAT